MNLSFGSMNTENLNILQRKKPAAFANVKGSGKYKSLRGTVKFYEARNGFLVLSEFYNLPSTAGACENYFLGFHIHEGKNCTGNETDLFADAGAHLNPFDCEHPMHMGDMPPLLVNDGYAWNVFFTNKVTLSDILGHAVIVHSKADDFHTQPSGNSGEKIACGIIKI